MLKEAIEKNIKNYWYFIIFIPIFINFLINIFSKSLSYFDGLNYYNLISTILLSALLYSFGNAVKNTLNFKSIHFGATFFILSFFIFDIFVLFFNKNITFKLNTYTVLSLWLLFFLIKKTKLNLVLISYSLIFINFIFNMIFLNKLEENTNIKVDAWYYFDFSKNIYENNFFYSMNNNIFTGYSQFSSYIHSLFYNLSFNIPDFFYYRSTTNVLFFLISLLLIEEVKKNKLKLFIFLLFFTLVINSDWLSFLMFDSLMSEGVLNFLFTSSLLTTLKNNNVSKYGSMCLGVLVFSKQFFITLILFTVIYFLFSKNLRKNIHYLLLGIIFKEITFMTIFQNIEKDHHIRQIDLIDTAFDLLLFRDLNVMNVVLIGKNLLKDIPFSYFLFLLIVLFTINLYLNISNRNLNFLFILVLLNIILILLLYISVWRNMELESPIRFILNLFVLKLAILSKVINNIDSKIESI